MSNKGKKPVVLPDQKAADNPKSRKLAIYAKCYDCNGTDQDPGWRARIGRCPVTKCPLWPFRPYQGFADSQS